MTPGVFYPMQAFWEAVPGRGDVQSAACTQSDISQFKPAAHPWKVCLGEGDILRRTQLRQQCRAGTQGNRMCVFRMNNFSDLAKEGKRCRK